MGINAQSGWDPSQWNLSIEQDAQDVIDVKQYNTDVDAPAYQKRVDDLKNFKGPVEMLIIMLFCAPEGSFSSHYSGKLNVDGHTTQLNGGMSKATALLGQEFHDTSSDPNALTAYEHNLEDIRDRLEDKKFGGGTSVVGDALDPDQRTNLLNGYNALLKNFQDHFNYDGSTDPNKFSSFAQFYDDLNKPGDVMGATEVAQTQADRSTEIGQANNTYGAVLVNEVKMDTAPMQAANTAGTGAINMVCEQDKYFLQNMKTS